MRADQLVTRRGLAPTRSAAQRMIASGAVRWLAPAGWAVTRKAGEELPDDCQVEVTDDAELRFVSRGGLKLEAAIAQCGIDVAGQGLPRRRPGHRRLHRRAAAARRGARRRRRGRARPDPCAPVGRPARHRARRRQRAPRRRAAQLPVARFDLIVGDLSFISLALVLPALVPLLDGDLLLLVKPQFELQRVDIGKGGLVKSKAAPTATSRRSCARPARRTASRSAPGSRARSTAATATASSSCTRARSPRRSRHDRLAIAGAGELRVLSAEHAGRQREAEGRRAASSPRRRRNSSASPTAPAARRATRRSPR